MKILEKGHIYELGYLDDKGDTIADLTPAVMQNQKQLVFVNREPGHEHSGTQTQEVLRALIDRTYHCDHCMPSELNGPIIYHLRMALVYHEMRALERKAEKGYYDPEDVSTGGDGHFKFAGPFADDPNRAPRRDFLIKPDERLCKRLEY